MATKKPAAKKTVAKKPSKKSESASASKVPSPIRAPETDIDRDANSQAITAKDGRAGTSEPPKIHAKSISLIVSVGTYDRKRNIEAFIEDVLKKLGQVPYGEEGIHATVTGSYYILDGKVCLPDDYDPKTQNFKPGAVPPQWAGGPKPTPAGAGSTQEQMARDARELSRDEYDKKYKIGKYRQLGTGGQIITPEMQRKMREDAKAAKESEDEELDFDWDEDDVNDDAKLGAIADESASEFTKKVKATKKKRVVKKKTESASQPKRKQVTVKKPVKKTKKGK